MTEFLAPAATAVSTIAAPAEASFMIFMLDSLLVGIAAAEIESVSSGADGSAADAAAAHSGETGNVSRLLVLRDRRGIRPLVRTQGALRVVSLPTSQVVALPRLCVTAGGAPIAVALTEDQILFLIIDPYRLPHGQAGSTSEAGIISSMQESR